jgi:cobalamin-dependent methionine synthase I
MISVSLDLVLPEPIRIERILHIDRDNDRKLLKNVFSDAGLFFSPKYSYRTVRIEDEPVLSLLSVSQNLREFLENSIAAFIVICTIGSGFEKLSDNYRLKGDMVSLFFLDRIGSDTVENLAKYSSQKLLIQFYGKGPHYALGRRYSPGYGDLPLQRQQEIFALFHDKETDVTLNESGFMVPEKSISYIVGVKNA